jgi:hypothetical protein
MVRRDSWPRASRHQFLEQFRRKCFAWFNFFRPPRRFLKGWHWSKSSPHFLRALAILMPRKFNFSQQYKFGLILMLESFYIAADGDGLPMFKSCLGMDLANC